MATSRNRKKRVTTKNGKPTKIKKTVKEALDTLLSIRVDNQSKSSDEAVIETLGFGLLKEITVRNNANVRKIVIVLSDLNDDYSINKNGKLLTTFIPITESQSYSGILAGLYSFCNSLDKELNDELNIPMNQPMKMVENINVGMPVAEMIIGKSGKKYLLTYSTDKAIEGLLVQVSLADENNIPHSYSKDCVSMTNNTLAILALEYIKINPKLGEDIEIVMMDEIDTLVDNLRQSSTK